TNHHGVGGADPIEFGHRQLALVCAPAAEDDVALAEAELGADHVAALAPPPNAEVLGVQVLETYVDGVSGIGWFHTLVNALGEVAEARSRPAGTVEERRMPNAKAVGYRIRSLVNEA